MQIVLPIIAILTVLGAFSAWRRSPLYSVGIALKLLGVFLLIVAATVGVSMGIVNGPISHSPAAQAILALVCIVGLGIGATAALVRITDAHVAQLPQSVQLVTIHRHKAQRWIWRLIAYLLIAAVAALLLPSWWKWLPLFLGGFVLLGCGPMLTAYYMYTRRLDRGMSAVLASPWAHWQYTPAQWEAWAQNQLEWERSNIPEFAWKSKWRAVVVLGLVFAGCSLVADDGAIGEKAVITVAGTALVIVIVLVANWSSRGDPERHYRRLRTAPLEAYFGAEGFFCNGEYSPWILSGKFLVEASAATDPPARLVLTFETFTGRTSVRVAKRIPIPDGHMSDLALLQEKLREHCGTAKVHLSIPAA